MLSHRSGVLLAALGLLAAVPACSDYRESGNAESTDRSTRRSVNPVERDKADRAIADMKAADPSMDRFFSNSYAYAVFPEISKGAAGIGAAHGDGVVYQNGVAIGEADMTQVTVGLQLGGQSYREIVFFQSARDFDHFTADNMEFSANASAVAAKAGAGSTADYHNGVAVFVLPHGGLMFEASIGGQKFDYHEGGTVR